MRKLPNKLLIAVVTLHALTATALAQQSSVAEATEIVGFDRLLATMNRIEQQLGKLVNQRWEYQFVQRNRLQDSQQLLANLGGQGWELVNVTNEEGYIFKRPLR